GRVATYPLQCKARPAGSNQRSGKLATRADGYARNVVVEISFLLACSGDGADDSHAPDPGTDTGTPEDPPACADGAATRVVGAEANGIGHAVEIVGDA